MQQLPCKIEKSDIDWSGFPSDLLFFISQRLPKLSDFIRFRSVCKNWRLSTPRSVAPPQLPWLIKFWHDGIHVSSLSSGKACIIQVPQMVKKLKLIGSGKSYILACDCENNSLSLMNLLTDEQHPLPPLPEYICTIKLVVQISCKDNITLVCYSKRFTETFFCRLDGQKWSIVECKRVYSFAVSCAYYEGMYFVIWGSPGRKQPTEVINATTGQVVFVINPPLGPGSVFHEYMVESFGDILRVQLLFNGLHPSFRIYLLDYEGCNSRWIQLRSIGDRILFLANPLSLNLRLYGFTLRTCNVTGSKGNCIYLFTYGMDGFGLHRYDIEDNKADLLPMFSFPGVAGDWFVPSLH